MPARRRAILVDIHAKKLDPKVAHTGVDTSGHLRPPNSDVVEPLKKATPVPTPPPAAPPVERVEPPIVESKEEKPLKTHKTPKKSPKKDDKD